MTIEQFTAGCEKAMTHLKEVFGRLQLGRASTWLVENINVYVSSRWSSQKLVQVGNITIMDVQTIKVEPRDKTILKDIEKAIYDAELGFNPLNQGEYIIIKVPSLTEERRRELTKVVSKDWEEAKITIRNLRQDIRKYIETTHKNEEISENEKNSQEKQIDEAAKQYNDKVDQLVKSKSEEIMTV